MKLIIPLAAAALLLMGCENNDDRIAFDGQFFGTKVKKVDKNFDVFTVKITHVSRSLDGARQAGHHAGVAWCVEHFGNSDIKWTVGPETPADQLQIVKDTMVFSGVCPQR